MENKKIEIHYAACLFYGKGSSCGNKVDHLTEEKAIRAAINLSQKREKDFEAYPCYWCKGWHIGRKLTKDEIDFILNAKFISTKNKAPDVPLCNMPPV